MKNTFLALKNKKREDLASLPLARDDAPFVRSKF